MTGPEALAGDEQVLQAFRVIDERLAAGGPRQVLDLLRGRLIGELLGDSRRVAAALTRDFSLVTHAGGSTTTLAGRDMVHGITRQGDAGVMLWTELDHLVADSSTVGGDGLLHTYQPDPGSVTSLPFAFFIRYAEGLMASEAVYLDVAATVTTPVPEGSRPSVDRIRGFLDA